MQKLLFAFVVTRRQRIDVAKTEALCKASICGIDTPVGEQGSALIRDAAESLRKYQKLALNLESEEEKIKEKMAKALANESRAYTISLMS